VWGEAGYGRIAIGTNNVGFEERMAYPNPVPPSQCTNGPRTCEHGERAADCSCKCYPPWQGVACGLCLRNSIACSNGGVLDAASCTCACPSGYFGEKCEFYVRASWTTTAAGAASSGATTATAEAGSNSCPARSERIVDSTQCQSVAAAMGKTYKGTKSISSYPNGCFLYKGDVVYLNPASGAGNSQGQLLCTLGAPHSLHAL
jgi:hypothetical protein